MSIFADEIRTHTHHDFTGYSHDGVVRWLTPADFYRAELRREQEYARAESQSFRPPTFEDFLDAN